MSNIEPSRIALKLTNSCNMNCGFCMQAYSRRNNKKEQYFLDFNLIKNFFCEDFTTNDKTLFLWGGEPLLHPEWMKFAQFGKEKKWRIQLNTNGWNIKKNINDIIYYVDDLIISLDGLDVNHDNLRKKQGAYNRVKDSVFDIFSRTNKKYISINSVITNDLIDELDEFIDEVMSWPILGVVLQLPMFIPKENFKKRINVTGDISFKFEESNYFKPPIISIDTFINKYNRLLQKYRNQLAVTPSSYYLKHLDSYFYTSKFIGTNFFCPEINNGIAIEPSGKVVACSDFPETAIGEINNKTWKEIYYGEPIKKIRNHFSKNGPWGYCSRCCHLYNKNTNG